MESQGCSLRLEKERGVGGVLRIAKNGRRLAKWECGLGIGFQLLNPICSYL